MDKIEERAKEYADRHKSIENSYFSGYNYNYNIAEKYDAEKFAYEAGAYDQKAIDDAELSKLKSSWGNETQVNRRCYIKGYRDAIDKACEWLKNNLREYGIILFGNWESDFRKAMEEEK